MDLIQLAQVRVL